MIRNYIKTAWRSLLRNRGFSFINIIGLAGGLAVCLFILTLIIDQNNYDRFHENGDRIYRILADQLDSDVINAAAPLVLANTLKEQSPAVEKVTAIQKANSWELSTGAKTLEFFGLYATPTFFDFFDFPLLYGDRQTALDKPYSIILSESAFAKLELKESDLGSTIYLGDSTQYTITGVTKALSQKSHIRFEFLVSDPSGNGTFNSNLSPESDWQQTYISFVYFLLRDNARLSDVQYTLNEISEKVYANAERKLAFVPQGLSAITPTVVNNNELSSTLPLFVLNFLAIVGILVLLTACFNYTNLTVASSLTRAKEIGVRKVMGARRHNILFQFIAEAILVALVAFVIAIVMLEFLMLPQFSKMFLFPQLNFNLNIAPGTYLLFFGLSVLTGLIAGLIPSLYLSAFKPVRVLNKITTIKVFSKIGVRQLLIGAQFLIALIFFATIYIVNQQEQHMLQADYGFDTENVINLHLQDNDYKKVKAQLESYPSIQSISMASLLPASGVSYSREIILPNDEEKEIYLLQTDAAFIPTIGLNVLAGRAYSENDITGMSQLILNEHAIRSFGWVTPQDAIQQIIKINTDEGRVPAKIIGVVEDFHHQDITNPIRPLMITHEPNAASFLNLKVRTGDIPETLAFIRKEWKKIDPVREIDIAVYNEFLYERVAFFNDAVKLLGFITFITILITCMGLMGISSYTAQTRRKEVGIRKVLGASVSQIIWALSKAMMISITIAVILGIPIVYLLNSAWLQSIAYSIELNFLNIGFGIAFMFLLGIGIVASQAWRTAVGNPADALRIE